MNDHWITEKDIKNRLEENLEFLAVKKLYELRNSCEEYFERFNHLLPDEMEINEQILDFMGFPASDYFEDKIEEKFEEMLKEAMQKRNFNDCALISPELIKDCKLTGLLHDGEPDYAEQLKCYKGHEELQKLISLRFALWNTSINALSSIRKGTFSTVEEMYWFLVNKRDALMADGVPFSRR